MKTFFAAAMAVLSCVLPSVCLAQGTSGGGEAEFRLPADPTMWVNSGPITSDALKGKAALLWFYEEGCPSCRRKWPEMVQLAKKYEDKPIVFIAVNSGNPRPAVEQYLRSVRVGWPTIVDPARQFEQLAGVDEISLQNIHQARIITADGRIGHGDWSNLEETVERAIAGAKWMVAPDEVPAALKQAWLNIEFNQFAVAGPIVKKGLASNKPEVKEAAEKLDEAVRVRIAAEIAVAEEAVAAGEKWKAYKAFKQIHTQYAGFTLPDTVLARGRELIADEEVKQQVAAGKALDAAKKALRSTSSGSRRSGQVRLKKLVAEYAGTEAAAEAEQLLTQLGESS